MARRRVAYNALDGTLAFIAVASLYCDTSIHPCQVDYDLARAPRGTSRIVGVCISKALYAHQHAPARADSRAAGAATATKGRIPGAIAGPATAGTPRRSPSAGRTRAGRCSAVDSSTRKGIGFPGGARATFAARAALEHPGVLSLQASVPFPEGLILPCSHSSPPAPGL